MKNNLLKRGLLIIFSLVFALSCSAVAFAVSNLERLSVDEKLIAMGFPTESLITMPALMKADIAAHYEEGAYYGGSEETLVNIPNNKSGTRDITSAQLSLVVSYIVLPTSADGTENRKVYADFEWLVLPTTGFNDVFGVLWGNGWCLSDDYNPVFTYQYRGAESNEMYTEFYPMSTDGWTSAPNQGLTYNNLVLRSTVKAGNEAAIEHAGWLTIQLERQGGSMSTNVIASYSKAKFSLIPTLSVDIEGWSVSISPEINYENELQSAANFVMY